MSDDTNANPLGPLLAMLVTVFLFAGGIALLIAGHYVGIVVWIIGFSLISTILGKLFVQQKQIDTVIAEMRHDAGKYGAAAMGLLTLYLVLFSVSACATAVIIYVGF